MESKTIKMAKAKTLSFGICQAKVFQCEDGLWMAGFLFNCPADMPDHHLFLETFRGDLRLFKSADAAINAVKEVVLDKTEIIVDWAGRGQGK